MIFNELFLTELFIQNHSYNSQTGTIQNMKDFDTNLTWTSKPFSLSYIQGRAPHCCGESDNKQKIQHQQPYTPTHADTSWNFVQMMPCMELNERLLL